MKVDSGQQAVTVYALVPKGHIQPQTKSKQRRKFRNRKESIKKSLGITNINQMKKSALLILVTTALTTLMAITARAQNPVVAKIFVTTFRSAKVTVFLTNGLQTTPKIKTQRNPAGVAVASNGNIYVANFGANTVTTYDATGKPITPTITGLSGPFALAFSAYDQNFYVLNQTNATITKYTPDGTVLLATIALPISTVSDGFAIASDGTFWVSQSNAGNMLHVNASGNLISQYVVGGTPAGVALPSDGSVLFADTSDNDVVRLDPSTGNLTTFVSGLAQPVGLAIDGNGNVYVSNRGSNTVTTYDSTGKATTPTLSTSAYPVGIAVQ
jgi:YVTN family beta-propeller protein